jgi:hypothetical protein
LRLCGGGNRPSIELEPTDHALAIEQRQGISIKRVEEIASARARFCPKRPTSFSRLRCAKQALAKPRELLLHRSAATPQVPRRASNEKRRGAKNY